MPKETWIQCTRDSKLKGRTGHHKNKGTVASTSKPVHVKQLDFTDSRRNALDFLAPDEDLARIKPIHVNKLVTEWIEKGTYISAALSDEDANPSSSDVKLLEKNLELRQTNQYDDERCDNTESTLTSILPDFDKSPVLTRRKRSVKFRPSLDNFENRKSPVPHHETSPIIRKKNKFRGSRVPKSDYPPVNYTTTSGLEIDQILEVLPSTSSDMTTVPQQYPSMSIFKSFNEYYSDELKSVDEQRNNLNQSSSFDALQNCERSPILKYHPKSEKRSDRASRLTAITSPVLTTNNRHGKRKLARSPILNNLKHLSEHKPNQYKRRRLNDLFKSDPNNTLVDLTGENPLNQPSECQKINSHSTDIIDIAPLTHVERTKHVIEIDRDSDIHISSQSSIQFICEDENISDPGSSTTTDAQQQKILPLTKEVSLSELFSVQMNQYHDFRKLDTKGVLKKMMLGTKLPSRRFFNEQPKLVMESEYIDCDTECEAEKGESQSDHDMKIEESESDSDKTVSDFIEEPNSQFHTSPVKVFETRCHPSTSRTAPINSLTTSITASSIKISDTTSPTEPTLETVSSLIVSQATSPPRTEDNEVSLTILLDSGKKKRKPKKGTLGAHLQRLIAGQASNVRLWRHQMCRASIEKSFINFCVIESCEIYEKTLFRSRVIHDPDNLLPRCADTSSTNNIDRTVILMTTYRFVGKPQWVPGTLVNVYPPFEVFNRECINGDMILHVTKYLVTTNFMKTEPVTAETESLRRVVNKLTEKVIVEYDCPCLQQGRIVKSCSSTNSNRKANALRKIFKL